jgi:hypothetical protein
VRWAALALAAVLLCGCETTAERSAQLERQAKRNGAGHGSGARATHISAPSRTVTVVSKSLVKGAEGDAVVLRLRNNSSTATREVPVQVTVHDSRGASLYTNATPGLAATLASAPLIGPHATAVWIDDQVTTAGTPARVTAVVGEGHPATGATTPIEVAGVHLNQEASGTAAEGNVVNHSPVAQHEVVVDAIATSGGRILAAGRAVIPEVAAGASTPFQLFFIGNPQGGRLELAAAPAAAAAASSG